MNNTNYNSWYFNKSSDLGGTRLDLIYKRVAEPLDKGFVNGIELPGDTLITGVNKSMIVNEILEVLSIPNPKNKLSVLTSFIDSSVDLPSFLIDSLKDIGFLQNFYVSGFFNPFDISSLTMFNGEKDFFSGTVNRVFIDLFCPDGFEGGKFKMPVNVDSLNVKSSDMCLYSGRSVHLDACTNEFKSSIKIEADQFNYGRFRNLKELSASNFESIRSYHVDSVSH